MRPELSRRVLLVLGLAGLLLQACGGGGGGGDSPTPPPPPAQYTLSGTIRPAAGTAIDSDVNDPGAPYQSNDTPADAQPIPNPVTLGGYANQRGSGPSGRSRTTGDVRDNFKVSLLAGQQINLLIAGDGVRNDLDLGLIDSDGKLIDASVSQRRVESLTVPRNGDYLVVVTAVKGASNYVLTIGQALTSAGTGMRLSDEFVPGDAIVRFGDDTAARAGGLRAQAQAFGLTAQSRGEKRERNRKLKSDDLRRMGVYRTSASAQSTGDFSDLELADPALRDKLDTLYAIKTLNGDPDVVAATPNYLVHPLFAPNDPLYRFQWHYPQLNLPQAWDLTTGDGVIVAVVDTGVVLSHPDLQGQLVDGYDFIKDRAIAGDGDGIDPNPEDPGDHDNPDGSSSFHGTHVTGTVVAATNNSLGVAGVAFGARVMPLRAVGQGGGDQYDVEQAVRFAAGLPNDSGTVPPRRADVINLSLGSTYSTAEEQAVYDQARAAGVVIVAAAGNSASATPFYPAAYNGVIAVSAADIEKNLAPYSSFGSWVDVAAPGGNTARDVNGDGKPDGVMSTVASDSDGVVVNDYVIWQGTSMASPHMAGVVALMKALAPNLSPQDVDSLLASGALTDDIGVAGRDDKFGYGLINAYKAAAVAASSGGKPVDPIPVLTINPAALNFGISFNSQNLTVQNGGSGDLRVEPPTEDSGGWLSVIPTQVNASGLGLYTVSVNRAGLADGVYSASVTFTSNAGTFQVKVIMQVANNLSTGEIGQQYVVVVDASTGEQVTDAVADRQPDGSYTYTTRREVPAGNYQIFAGSDANNNLYICDTGESCGAYLTIDAPVSVQVDRDLSGLDFVSGYTVNLADYQTASAGQGGQESTGIRRGGTTRQLRRAQ